jgi:uncharacterized protein (DUF58 family)
MADRRRLSLRGTGIAAGASTCLLAAFVTGQALLLAAALVGLALVGGALIAMRSRSAPPISTLRRTLASPVVPVGSTVAVELGVTAGELTPLTTLRCTEELPANLGDQAPTWMVPGAHHVRLTYQVMLPHRGRLELGPLRLRETDPFGLVARTSTVGGTATLLVTPQVVDLPRITIAGATAATGEQRPRSFASGSAEDLTVREYRHGDDLRRVHWRSTARLGELMVRREEQPWQARATVLIDNRAGGYRGTGPQSGFELAISAAASIACHLLDQGFSVRLASAAGVLVPGTQLKDPLLEAFAELDTTSAPVLDPTGVAEPTAVTFAVLGGATAEGLDALRQARLGSSSAVALVVQDTGAVADILREGGWRSGSLADSAELVTCWAGLGSGRG